MSFFLSDINPVYVFRRKGDLLDPFVSIVETIKVNNTGLVILKEIPDKFNRVKVKTSTGVSYLEAQKYDGLKINQFFVDYALGLVYFVDSEISKNLVFTYMGSGVVSLGSSRVFVEDNGQHPTKTLQDMLDESAALLRKDSTAIDAKVLEATAKIAETELARVNAVTQANYAKTQGDAAKLATTDATTAKNATITATTQANTARDAANLAATGANTATTATNAAITAATTATTAANTAKTNADTATGKANTAATNADAKATLAVTATTNANTATSAANTAKTNADTAATNANTATTNTTAAINTANTAATNADAKATLAVTATTQANTARDNANTATTAANTARDAANTAKTNADIATGKANVAATAADVATGKTNTAITSANEATANADIATGKTNTAITNATVATTAANTATVNANTAKTNADTATTQANAARDGANTAKTNADVATGKANTATTQANTARDAANTATTATNVAITNANTSITAANAIVEELRFIDEYSSLINYKKNNLVSYLGSTYIAKIDSKGVTPAVNASWGLAAQRGIDGKGSISMVNSISPDISGNLTLTHVNVGAAPTLHNHPISQITGLNDSITGLTQLIDGKAPTIHGHTVTQVTGLQAALDSKETPAGATAKVTAHAVENAPHTYGGKFRIAFNPIFGTLDFEVIS